MLGVCLLFVGIVLINNGMCSLYNVDGKSTAIMNIFTGGLSLFINFVNLVQGNYYAAGTGLLFCFTYLFVALSKFLKASPIPFAWFSTFVAINAVIFGTIEGFTGSTALGITPDLRWAAIWYLWAILWGTAFVEDICGKKLGKFAADSAPSGGCSAPGRHRSAASPRIQWPRAPGSARTHHP